MLARKDGYVNHSKIDEKRCPGYEGLLQCPSVVAGSHTAGTYSDQVR